MDEEELRKRSKNSKKHTKNAPEMFLNDEMIRKRVHCNEMCPSIVKIPIENHPNIASDLDL